MLSTFTATLLLSKMFPAAVVDLGVTAAGLVDAASNTLNGEWTNGVTLGSSGDTSPGGDFSFRIFVLPGDAIDQSGGSGTRTVNATDAQHVRDTQNGFAPPAFGVFGYDPRADLDGSSFVNTDDSQYERDQQNAIIYQPVGATARVLVDDLGAKGDLFAIRTNENLAIANDMALVDFLDEKESPAVKPSSMLDVLAAAQVDRRVGRDWRVPSGRRWMRKFS